MGVVKSSRSCGKFAVSLTTAPCITLKDMIILKVAGLVPSGGVTVN